jgi:serine/threonine protein kinase
MGSSCSCLATLSSVTPLSGSSTPLQSQSYHRSRIIGKGGYATVYCGYNKQNNKKMAMKLLSFDCIRLKEYEVEMAISELSVYKRAGTHHHLSALQAAFYETKPRSHNCYLILDFHSGGDLRHHLKTSIGFHEHHVAYFISSIGSALNHLHERGIIHRDVKPENIVLDSFGRPKLTDFGTAYVEEKYSSLPICRLSSGTLPYMAPEMLTRSRLHSYQSDFWALGVTAYELLFNNRPFMNHCPKRYMYFSANQYQCLWNRLQEIQPSTLHSEDFCSCRNDSPAVNFNIIDQSITPQTRQTCFPHPHRVISLLSTGATPFDLTVPVPLYSNSGDPVSRECLDFLQSILDVRIPQRLGQLSHFHLFEQHPWFQKFNYSLTPSQQPGFPSTLENRKSPYQPNVSLVEHLLQSKFKGIPMDPSVPPTPPADDPSVATASRSLDDDLSDRIKQRLLENYSFLPSSSHPSCSCVKRKPSTPPHPNPFEMRCASHAIAAVTASSSEAYHSSEDVMKSLAISSLPSHSLC